MRRQLLAAAAGLGLAFAMSGAAQATPVRAVPAASCYGTQFYWTNASSDGLAYFVNSINRLTMANQYTALCADDNTNPSFIIIGTNNCITYAGPKTGRSPLGYIDATPCLGHASEVWTWGSDNLLHNHYANNWCLDGPKLGGKPFLEACSTGDDSQVWYSNGIGYAPASPSPSSSP